MRAQLSKSNLRKVNASVLVLRGVPYEIGTFLVLVIGVRDRSAFGYCFGVLAVLPCADPFIGVCVTCLNPKAAEMLVATNRYWKKEETSQCET